MALNPGLIQASFMTMRTSAIHSLLGIDYDRFAQGMGLAVFQWAVGQPQNLALLGTATGTLGTGIIAAPTTRLIVPPNPGLIKVALMGAGVNGATSSSLSLVVSSSISQVFSTYGQYMGSSGAVGVGASVAKVTVANAATLTGILRGTLLPIVGKGPVVNFLSIGLGNGIAGMLMTGTGFGAVTGTPSVPPLPGASPTFSTVV